MFLDVSEGSGGGLGLNKCPLLDAVCDWGGDGAKTTNEVMVERRETMKAPDIMECAGFGPFNNGSYFL